MNTITDRPITIILLLFLGMMLPLPLSLPACADEPEAVAAVIGKAGNAEDEKERYRLLLALSRRTDLAPTLRADLEQLLPLVDLWANGKERTGPADPRGAAENGYLCHFITGKVKPEGQGAVYPPAPAEGSPLRPIWAMYRGRMLVWRVIQSGPLLRVKEDRDAYYGEAQRLLGEARDAFPKNRVVRMYLSEPIPWPKAYEAAADAPEWANLQREGLEKLTDVIHWWIDERQLPDGQFGGGWGDDVEMWRWWTPILVGFDDPKVAAAQERISGGIFKQDHLKQGFTSRMTDVEHSNEDTTDTILPMLYLKPDDPVWKARALRLTELMRDRWTGKNERGFLQFKSIYFSVDRVDESPGRAFDTVYHASIVQPTLLLWQRTGDPALTALLGDWLKVWVDAAAREENGKPAGILPSALRWPSGAVGAPDKPWWQPFAPSHNDALYNWPGATQLMTSTLLLGYRMTGEERYLAPLHSMAAIRQRHPNAPADAEPGSEAWCARQMRSFLPDTLAKYRFLTGDTRYNSLLRGDASGYVRYRLSGDTAPLVSALQRNAEAFRSNWEGYTQEMRWTDRVMNFTGNYLNYLGKPAPPAPSPHILYTSSTGDPGNPLVFPLNAVRWLTPPRDIAALVTESGRERFAAELFHFRGAPRKMGAEFYLLQPGTYTLTVTDAKSAQPIGRTKLDVRGPRARTEIELPSRKLCILRIERAGDR